MWGLNNYVICSCMLNHYDYLLFSQLQCYCSCCFSWQQRYQRSSGGSQHDEVTNVDLMLGQRRRRWANLSCVCWRVHNRYTSTALVLLKIIQSGLLNSRCTFQYPMGSDFPSRILGSGVQCVTDAIDAKWRSLHPLFPMGSIYQIMSNAILLIGMDMNNLQSNNFNWV